MALILEYLEEAVIEAAAATAWYATRSAVAAAGFEAELEQRSWPSGIRPMRSRRTITEPAGS